MKDGRRATVKDISEMMNVSLSTVNKALTGKTGVSEKRRAEIVAAARELGYEVNHVAQSLSRSMIKIGVVIPRLWQEYFGAVEDGMKTELGKLAQNKVEGVFKRVADAAGIERAFSELYDEGVDVIVYCPSLIEIPESVRTAVKKRGVPIFIAGDSCDGLPSVCQVLLNSGLSARMAADILSLAAPAGSEAAVFVGSMKLASHREKADAFCQRAKEVGFSDVAVYETFDNISSVEKSVSEMTRSHPRVKAVYAATAVIGPIVVDLERRAPDERPAVVATDIYDEVREAVRRGLICATVFQNQKLIGRLSVRKAYDYVVQKKSYGDVAYSGSIYVTPQLFVPSRIDEFGFGSGDEYVLENN